MRLQSGDQFVADAIDDRGVDSVEIGADRSDGEDEIRGVAASCPSVMGASATVRGSGRQGQG
jgi:hypothetical protein